MKRNERKKCIVSKDKCVVSLPGNNIIYASFSSTNIQYPNTLKQAPLAKYLFQVLKTRSLNTYTMQAHYTLHIVFSLWEPFTPTLRIVSN